MGIIEIQESIDDNQDDLLSLRRQLKRLQDKLKISTDESQKGIIENRIIDCNKEILECQKEDYNLKGQLRDIKLQEMEEELGIQLENGLITQLDYDTKMDKLKTFSATQKAYTDVKVAECEQKVMSLSSKRSDLDESTKEGMNRSYQVARRNKINKLTIFTKKRQELELSILRQKVTSGEISPEEYADKVKYVESTTNMNLEEFEGMYDDLKIDIEAPRLEEQQALQMLSEIKKYKGKTINYQGKEQNFDDLLLEHIAGRIAEEQQQYDDLRKSAPAFQDLPDLGIDKIEDLQAHIKEQLTTLLPDGLESLLKSGQKDIAIPTTDGKSISYPAVEIKRLIREMGPVIEEQKKYEMEQQSSENVVVGYEQWQEPEEQSVNIEELQNQIEENTARINSEKEYIASLTMNQEKGKQFSQAGLDANAISSINSRKKLESKIQISQWQKENMEYSGLLKICKAQNLEEDLREKLRKGEIAQSEFDEKMQDIRVYKLYTNLDMEVQRANYEIAELKLRADSPDFDGNLKKEIEKVRKRIISSGILQRRTDLRNLKADEISRAEQMITELESFQNQTVSKPQDVSPENEESLNEEQESNQINFSELHEALRESETVAHESEAVEGEEYRKQDTSENSTRGTISRDEYLKRKMQAFFSGDEELMAEIEEIGKKFSLDELKKISEEVPIDNKIHVGKHIDGEIINIENRRGKLK